MRKLLSDLQVAEAAALRASDPTTWTYRALAWRYGVSEGYIERRINGRSK